MRAALMAVLLAAGPAAAQEARIFTCLFAETVIIAGFQMNPDGSAVGLGSLTKADRVIVTGDRVTALIGADLLQFDGANSVVVLNGVSEEGTCRDVTDEAMRVIADLP